MERRLFYLSEKGRKRMGAKANIAIGEDCVQRNLYVTTGFLHEAQI